MITMITKSGQFVFENMAQAIEWQATTNETITAVKIKAVK